MIDVDTTLITDEDGRPVAVQVPYEDWKRVEAQLSSSDDAHEEDDSPPSHSEEPSSQDERSLRELAEAARPYWEGGDGLEFQRRLRSEWNRPWYPDSAPEKKTTSDETDTSPDEE
jgi:hypothetical protein